MGDAENRSSMDNSSSSSDELVGAEKKMKVDDSNDDPVKISIVSPVEDITKSEQQTKVMEEGQHSNGDNEETQQSCSVAQTASEASSLLTCDHDQEMLLAPNVLENEETVLDPVVDLSDKTTEVEEEELIDLKVTYNKKPLKIRISLSKTIGDLKLLIEEQTKVAPALQKVLIKGIAKDDVTLKSLGVSNLTKILVIGSCLSDVMAVSAPPPDKETFAAEESNANKQSVIWCTLPQHKKVIDKGVPEDVMPGISNLSEPLPDIPLFGMLSTKGAKVRLTFKLELDELWIGTKERTDKVPIGSIRNVESQPITGYEHYHILAIQLGPTEASRFFVYWVPAQYVEAIKDAVAN